MQQHSRTKRERNVGRDYIDFVPLQRSKTFLIRFFLDMILNCI